MINITALTFIGEEALCEKSTFIVFLFEFDCFWLDFWLETNVSRKSH